MKEELYLDSQQYNKLKKLLASIKKDKKSKLKVKVKNLSFEIKGVCRNCQAGEPIPHDTWCASCRSVD